MNTIHGLSGKAKLALEAASKVVKGEQLIKEGTLELSNLFPNSDSKTIANRILKYSDPKKSKQETNTKFDDREKILKAIRESEWMTLSQLMKTTKVGWYLLNKIVKSELSKGTIKQVKKTKNPNHKGSGSYNKEYIYWVLA